MLLEWRYRTYFILLLFFRLQGPEVVIECGSIDLGLVRFGDTASFELSLRNMSRVQAYWSLEELAGVTATTSDPRSPLYSQQSSRKCLPKVRRQSYSSSSYSHFYVGSMYDDIRLHVARSYTSSPDGPFSLISFLTVQPSSMWGRCTTTYASM